MSKHVVFGEDDYDQADSYPSTEAGPSYSSTYGHAQVHAQLETDLPGPSASAGPSIHPDRLALSGLTNGGDEPVKKKSKSEAQKNREKKKLKKRRKLEQAKKAAAPKNKEWKPDPVLEALKKSTGEISETTLVDVENKENDQPPAAGEPPIASGKVVETDKEKRRREKREKREKRERKERRRLEREAKENGGSLQAADAKLTAGPANGADEIDVEMEDDLEGEERQGKDSGEIDNADAEGEGSDDELEDGQARSSSSSPPPLEAFPLPRLAPAPDAAVLARQGLPQGLQDAEFIDQNLRVRVDELEIPAAELTSAGGENTVLSDRMKRRLKETGVEEFFAVQAAILPHLLPLRLLPFPYTELHDYLISAPTGSGKTLAYSIPIVEILSKRVVTRLRALIVLPTRDLVVQVRDTLESLAKGTGLNIGAVTGQHSFAHEQSQLVADMTTPLLGGSSKLDILIATPGRLMDHLTSTPNFTLQHLRFLIIDEADRLLNQSFQNWLSSVLSYIRPPENPPKPSFGLKPWDKLDPAWLEAYGLEDRTGEWCDPIQSTCQKLLFSATLTRDPQKVAALALTSPKYYIVQSTSLPSVPTTIGEQFAFPSSLSEKMLILPPHLKPLNLIHLIHHAEYGVDRALVFTKSVEATDRLVRLLEYFEDAYVLGGGGGKRVVVKGYTGELKAGERKKLLAEFGDGKVNLLVCSDLIARGMDLPTVSHVVSYDIPLDMRKYVHRVGRTARAGREGTAWTLVEKQEALHFKGMMKTADHLKQIRKIKVKEDDLAGYRESYEIAMRRLREHFGRDA
ncbi:ATP-dependent RNA helicase DDX51/DBP6 [Kwoniella heveanensis CBS 569]|nr:ATP-dependent RNA helicase DDX51/DBP6 [Kwoniella heveanensis CBS 569]